MPKIERAPHRPWQAVREPHSGRVHTNTKFYASMAWRKLRKMKIEINPMCQECEARGLFVAGDVVDHIVPINKGGEPLNLDNLQTLCHKCHNRKSGREAHQ